MKELAAQGGSGGEKPKSDAEACRKIIRASLERTGFEGEISEELIQRLVLLEQGSKFNDHARQVEAGVANVLDYLAERYADGRPELVFSEEQRVNARVAAILHDIGKSGPAGATEEEQAAVVELFAIENVEGVDRKTVGQVIEERFSSDEARKERLFGCLERLGVSKDTIHKQFLNRHSGWTCDLLKKYPKGINDDIKNIASHHHLYNEDDSSALPRRNETGHGKMQSIGSESADLIERVLTVVDIYQAARGRSMSEHREAIMCVRRKLDKYKDDESLKLVIEAVDELGREDRIF